MVSLPPPPPSPPVSVPWICLSPSSPCAFSEFHLASPRHAPGGFSLAHLRFSLSLSPTCLSLSLSLLLCPSHSLLPSFCLCVSLAVSLCLCLIVSLSLAVSFTVSLSRYLPLLLFLSLFLSMSLSLSPSVSDTHSLFLPSSPPWGSPVSFPSSPSLALS